MNFYRNGNYIVCIMDDGTKIRKTEEDSFIPSFAENTDVKITSKCSIGCPFCYEGCTKDGEHADLFKYDFINSLHPYTEMALNGNDMNHPDLERFLMFLKEKKVFANITVQQKQFLDNYETLKKYTENKLIYGIGVSYSYYDEDFINKVKEFPNAVLHTINGLLSNEDIEQLKDKDLKILVLGYKKLQRGKDYYNKCEKMVNERQQRLYDLLPVIINENWFKVVSFDNLAIEQLDVKRLMPEDKWEEFYMGDDGKYTFYIDMVNGTFAKNSLSDAKFNIGHKTIDEMFNVIRGMLEYFVKINIRRGLFETNSSSTHAIVIGNNGQDIYKELPEKLEFHGGEFGWEHETYYDTQSKANYLYTSIVWCGSEIDVDDAIDKIRKILAKWNIDAEFEELNENGEFYGWSYVDHGYENKDLVKKLITNEELLMNYLFSENSSVETGNDNDDTKFTAEEPKNILFDYYKGN